MKLKFKNQAYQLEAVNAVVDCFEGQRNNSAIRYRIDPGSRALAPVSGFKNESIQILGLQLLENIQNVRVLPVSVHESREILM